MEIDINNISIKKIYTKNETLELLNDKGKISSMIDDKNEAKLMMSAIYWIVKE